MKAGRVYGYYLQLPESKTNKGYTILLNISMDFLMLVIKSILQFFPFHRIEKNEASKYK